MAGIQNNSARQYNLKQRLENGQILVVRVKPGLNFVDNKEWDEIKKLNIVKRLKDEGILIDGKPVKDAGDDIRAMSKTALLKQASEADKKADASSKANAKLEAENAEMREQMAEMKKQLDELAKASK